MAETEDRSVVFPARNGLFLRPGLSPSLGEETPCQGSPRDVPPIGDDLPLGGFVLAAISGAVVGLVFGALAMSWFDGGQVAKRDELIWSLVDDRHRCGEELQATRLTLLHVLGFKEAKWMHVEVKP